MGKICGGEHTFLACRMSGKGANKLSIGCCQLCTCTYNNILGHPHTGLWSKYSTENVFDVFIPSSSVQLWLLFSTKLGRQLIYPLFHLGCKRVFVELLIAARKKNNRFVRMCFFIKTFCLLRVSVAFCNCHFTLIFSSAVFRFRFHLPLSFVAGNICMSYHGIVID